jgi:phosphodiesterase/alkaline phosphatase D-like protein
VIKRIVSALVLLTCVVLQAVPAMASTSDSTIVSGTVPLLIFDVQASGITGHAATISWQTNGSASSQVFYDNVSHGDTAGYAHHSNLDNTPVVLHSVTLNGLSPSTTYHYRVKSVAVIDGDVFTAVSPDLTFKTSGTAPYVMTMWALPVSKNYAVLWGYLNKKGSASSVEVYFQYGATKTYGSETPHQTIARGPSVFVALVNNLQPNTTYHFRAVAMGDGTSYGDDRVFRTLPLIRPSFRTWLP